MSLRLLISNQGLELYPNHNTPSTSGGFNYGNSYTPVFEGEFRQKTFNFGQGTAYDRPGLGFSEEPFVTNPLVDILSNNPETQLIVDTFTDGLIRGGAITHAERLLTDAERVGKFMTSPKGLAFVTKQVGLQLTNPKISEPGVNISRANQRTYNLGVNTLASVVSSGTGAYIKREGLLPTAFEGYADANKLFENNNNNRLINLFEGHVEEQTTISPPPEDPQTAFGQFLSNVGGYVSSFFQNLIGGGEGEKLYRYVGGPESVFGIGFTTIKKYPPYIIDATQNTNSWLRRNFFETGHVTGNNYSIAQFNDETSGARYVPKASYVARGKNSITNDDDTDKLYEFKDPIKGDDLNKTIKTDPNYFLDQGTLLGPQYIIGTYKITAETIKPQKGTDIPFFERLSLDFNNPGNLGLGKVIKSSFQSLRADSVGRISDFDALGQFKKGVIFGYLTTEDHEVLLSDLDPNKGQYYTESPQKAKSAIFNQRYNGRSIGGQSSYYTKKLYDDSFEAQRQEVLQNFSPIFNWDEVIGLSRQFNIEQQTSLYEGGLSKYGISHLSIGGENYNINSPIDLRYIWDPEFVLDDREPDDGYAQPYTVNRLVGGPINRENSTGYYWDLEGNPLEGGARNSRGSLYDVLGVTLEAFYHGSDYGRQDDFLETVHDHTLGSPYERSLDQFVPEDNQKLNLVGGESFATTSNNTEGPIAHRPKFGNFTFGGEYGYETVDLTAWSDGYFQEFSTNLDEEYFLRTSHEFLNHKLQQKPPGGGFSNIFRFPNAERELTRRTEIRQILNKTLNFSHLQVNPESNYKLSLFGGESRTTEGNPGGAFKPYFTLLNYGEGGSPLYREKDADGELIVGQKINGIDYTQEELQWSPLAVVSRTFTTTPSKLGFNHIYGAQSPINDENEMSAADVHKTINDLTLQNQYNLEFLQHTPDSSEKLNQAYIGVNQSVAFIPRATLQDFRKTKTDAEQLNTSDTYNTQVSDYMAVTDKDRLYHRETRVNTGHPGKKIDGVPLGKNADGGETKSYDIYDPDTIDTINALDIFKEDSSFQHAELRDLIRFRIEALDGDNPGGDADVMVFRAFLDSFSDDYSGEWNDFQYNGRAEKFYTYGGFDRSLSFSFKIAAQSRHEMMPLYRKLNFLLTQTAPDYKGTRMRGSFSRLTIGSLIDRVPGFFTSISLSWQKEYPWDISINHLENGEDKDGAMVMPHILDVDCQFQPVHNFIPQKSISKTPFILSHANNRKLQPAQKWYNMGAASNYKKATVKEQRNRLPGVEIKS